MEASGEQKFLEGGIFTMATNGRFFEIEQNGHCCICIFDKYLD
jgi:hypothetical protein